MKRRMKQDKAVSYENRTANPPLNRLRRGLHHHFYHKPHYSPFTKEWEWEECCYHHVE